MYMMNCFLFTFEGVQRQAEHRVTHAHAHESMQVDNDTVHGDFVLFGTGASRSVSCLVWCLMAPIKLDDCGPGSELSRPLVTNRTIGLQKWCLEVEVLQTLREACSLQLVHCVMNE